MKVLSNVKIQNQLQVFKIYLGLIKKFFRELNYPLVPFEFYEIFTK